MKKLIFFISLLFVTLISYCQPNGQQQENNLTIRNDQPMLHLRGEGAVINFYNGDIRLLRTAPNVLSLTGGIMKISSDTVATQAYARAYGGGTSMTYPGAGIPLSTGAAWGVSITNNSTNWNTAYGWGNHASAGYAPLASPTFTGIPAAPTAAVGTSTTQVATTAYVQNEITAGIDLSAVVPYLADTIPLATFGAGLGFTADTACFNNDALIGSFYNEGSDTLVITQLAAWIKAGTGTETIGVQISWHATPLSGSATNLNAAALTITDHTAMTFDTSFANAKIPPNVCVWGILSGASSGNKPTFLSVTLSGYKIPTY